MVAIVLYRALIFSVSVNYINLSDCVAMTNPPKLSYLTKEKKRNIRAQLNCQIQVLFFADIL